MFLPNRSGWNCWQTEKALDKSARLVSVSFQYYNSGRIVEPNSEQTNSTEWLNFYQDVSLDYRSIHNDDLSLLRAPDYML